MSRPRFWAILLLTSLGVAALEVGRRRLAEQQLGRGLAASREWRLRAAEKHLRWARWLRPESREMRAELAFCRSRRGDDRGAEDLLAGIALQALDEKRRWRARLVRADIASAAGRGREAAAALEVLLAESRAPSAPAFARESESRALRSLGRTLHSELGETAAAEARLLEALAAATTELDQAWALLAIDSFYMAHRPEAARSVEERLEPAREVFEATGERHGQASALLALARVAQQSGDLSRHAELTDRASTLYDQTGHLVGPVVLDYYLAMGEIELERYPEAEERLRRCLERFTRFGNRSGARVAEMGLAGLRLRTGQLAAARSLLETLLADLEPTAHRSFALGLLGHVNLHDGDPRAAFGLYRQALQLDRKLGTEAPGAFSRTLTMLAQAALQMGDLGAAGRALGEARRLAGERGDVDGLVVALLSSADLAELEMAAARHDVDDLRTAQKHASATVAYLEAAIELQASDLEAAVSPFFFTHYWQSLERLRSLLLEWHLEDDVKIRAHQALFRLLEQMRHRSMRGVMAPRHPRRAPSGAEKEALLQMTALLASAAAEEVAPESLRSAYRQYAQAVLGAELREPGDGVAARRARPATLSALRSGLGEDAAVVLYAFGDEQVFALLIGRQAEVVVALPIDRPGLIDRIGLLVDLLQDSVAGQAAEWRPLAAALHEVLIDPLYAAGLEAGMDLGVVPIGVLNDLPFATLIDGDGTFLIENHVLWTAPSASAMLRRDPVPSEIMVAFGVDEGVDGPKLPAAGLEARDVAAAVGGRAFIGRAATEEALRRQLPARLLHVAAHGEMEPDLPLLSRLAFAAPEGVVGPEADGRLTVGEILSLDLDSQLVLLSSCRASASFGPRREDWAAERWGLGSAFLAAGAQQVIASQLPIADSGARDLMLELYRQLRAHPPAVALNRAQRKWQSSGDVGWLGFSVMGAMPDRRAGPFLPPRPRR